MMANIASSQKEVATSASATRSYDTIGIGPVFLTPCRPEILGDIKVFPEDFVVREICQHHDGQLVVADVENATCIAEILCAELKEPSSVEETEHKGKKRTLDGQVVRESYPRCASNDPLGSLSKVLEDICCIANDSASESKDQKESLFQQLQELNNKVLAAITTTQQQPSEELHPCLDFLVGAAHNTKENRSLLHDLIRQVFPLLKSDTAITNTESSGAKFVVTHDLRFFPILPFLKDPKTDAMVALYRFYRNGYQESSFREASHAASSSCLLPMSPQQHRHDRRPLHKTISTASNGMLGTKTLSPEVMEVHWIKKKGKNHRNHKTQPQNDSTLCIVQKRQCENLVMLQTLAKAFHCYVTDIGCAGIKDRQAVTFQFCTIPRPIQETTPLSNHITVVPLGRRAQPLRKGELHQNRFEIVLRNVKVAGDDSITPQQLLLDLTSATTHDGDNKYRCINFFGTQRVGEPGDSAVVGTRTFEIGRAMLRGEFNVAIELLLAGRRLVNGTFVEDAAFRTIWKESGGDAVATYNALAKSGYNLPREQAVLKGLKRHGKDNSLAVMRCLPRNERLFFYQSYVWNKMATLRIQRYGNEVCKGDLVYHHDPKGGRDDGGATVRVVDNLSLYTLDQVVLPLPGYNILYPENEIGQAYKALLAEDHVAFVKGVAEESTSKGSYRPLIACAEHLTLREKGADWKLQFDLPVGAYATMFLRELMRTTVARDNPTNGQG